MSGQAINYKLLLNGSCGASLIKIESLCENYFN